MKCKETSRNLIVHNIKVFLYENIKNIKLTNYD